MASRRQSYHQYVLHNGRQTDLSLDGVRAKAADQGYFGNVKSSSGCREQLVGQQSESRRFLAIRLESKQIQLTLRNEVGEGRIVARIGAIMSKEFEGLYSLKIGRIVDERKKRICEVKPSYIHWSPVYLDNGSSRVLFSLREG